MSIQVLSKVCSHDPNDCVSAGDDAVRLIWCQRCGCAAFQSDELSPPLRWMQPKEGRVVFHMDGSAVEVIVKAVAAAQGGVQS